MTVLTITVHGIPAPQGSKRHVGNGRMVEASKAVGPWREAVKMAAIDAITDRENEPGAKLWEPITGPVGIEVYFHFPRPRSHYGTGRNAGKVKLSAPLRPSGPPDLSKLVRSTEDALTDAGVWRDDALVISIIASKYYDSHGFHGANITITENRRDLR